MKRLIFFFVFIGAFSFAGNCADSLFDKGVEKIVEKEYSTAQEIFQKDIQKRPTYSSYYNLGIALGKLKKWKQAKWAFESALKYKPSDKEAIYNAQFATHQIDKNQEWSHPYSWATRIIIGLGTPAWTIIVLLSSIFLGLFLFVKITGRPSKFNQWLGRLIIPVGILFLLSFAALFYINKHFSHANYILLKTNYTDLYLSPNGVKMEQQMSPAERFTIQKYYKDSLWIKISSTDQKSFWIKGEDGWIY